MGLLRKIILGPSRKTVAILCFPMAAGCFFYTYLNGHIVPSQVPGSILVGIFFIAAGIGLLAKERRLRRVKVA